MARYHINEKGEPGLCKAKPGNCPLGSADEHHDSPEAARAAYEQKQHSSFSSSRPQDQSEFVIEPIKAERIKEHDVYEGSEVTSVQVGRKWVTFSTKAKPKNTLQIGDTIVVQREQYTQDAREAQAAAAAEQMVKINIETSVKRFETALANFNDVATKYGTIDYRAYSALIEAQASKEIAEQIKLRQEREGGSFLEAADGLREYYRDNLATHLINTGLSRSQNSMSNVLDDAKNAAILRFVGEEYIW